MGYPDASMARGDGLGGQAFDPLEMMRSAADLANPVVAARQVPWLASELMRLAAGRSGVSFAEGDRRFADVTWQDNFFFRQLGRSYRLFEEWTDRMAGATGGRWDRQARTRYLASVVTAVAPWRAAYTSTQVLGGDKQMAVVKSGHIQSFVNPATKNRYDYWQGPPAGDDPDQWLAGATEHHGSWWPQWIEWLTTHSGPEEKPPSALGNRKYPPLGPAPGTYVHQ